MVAPIILIPYIEKYFLKYVCAIANIIKALPIEPDKLQMKIGVKSVPVIRVDIDTRRIENNKTYFMSKE